MVLGCRIPLGANDDDDVIMPCQSESFILLGHDCSVSCHVMSLCGFNLNRPAFFPERAGLTMAIARQTFIHNTTKTNHRNTNELKAPLPLHLYNSLEESPPVKKTIKGRIDLLPLKECCRIAVPCCRTDRRL